MVNSWFGGTGAFTTASNWTDQAQQHRVPNPSEDIGVPSGTIQFSGNQVGQTQVDDLAGGIVEFDLSGGGLTISPSSAADNVVALRFVSPLTVQGANTLNTPGIADTPSDLAIIEGASVVDQMLPSSPGVPYLDLSLGSFTLEDDASFQAPGSVMAGPLIVANSSLAVGDIAAGPLTMTGGSINLAGVPGSAYGPAGGFGAAAIVGGMIKSVYNLVFASLAASGGAALSATNDILAGGTTSSLTGGSTVTAKEFEAQGTIDAATVTVTDIFFNGTITDGATITSAQAGTSGVIVSGGATRWTNKGPFNFFSGTSQISQGAAIDVDNGTQDAAVTVTAGTLAITDASSTLSDAGDMTVATTGMATLIVQKGGTLSVDGNLDIGKVAGGTGTVTINDDNTAVTVGGTLTIGDGGVGNLNVGAGATLDPPDIVLGAQAAPAGGVTDPVTGLHVTYLNTLQITGGDVEAGSVTVGQAGYGGILFAGGVSDSTLNAADDVTLAEQAGSEGQVLVYGTDAALTTGDLTIGSSGTALLTVASGNSATTNGDATLAENSGSQATVALGEDSLGGPGGGNADWSISGNLTVGDGGKATLESNASSLEVGGGSFTIGDQTGANGLVTMNGGQLSFGGTLTIGDQGSGTLLFQLGATNTADLPTIKLGEQKGGVGSLTVTGQGTELQAAELDVGGFGKGTAQITAGAMLVVNGQVDVADDAEGLVDAITVSGTSDVSINGDLSVGTYGVATLQVQTESQLAASGTITIGDHAGASAVVTINGSAKGAATPSFLGYGKTLVVGQDGVGTLLVQKGALAKPQPAGTGAIEIGAKADGSGTVTVQDAGSLLMGLSLAIGGTAAGAGGSGTLTIMTAATVDVTAVTIWSGGHVKLAGGTLQTDPITVNGGNIVGDGVVTGAITDDGSVTATGGTLELTGDVTGTGVLQIGDGGTLQLDATASVSQVQFLPGGRGEQLVLATITGLQGPIAGFVSGDTIDAAALVGATARYASDGTQTTLTFTNGQTDLGSLVFLGDDTAQQLAFDAATGGVTTTATMPCYVAGTRIRTPAGDVPVERLGIDDLVLTVSGAAQPIRWVGHRRVDCRQHPRPADILPIRIRANAFGPGTPQQDLLLSPDHAVFAEGVLIPIRHLQNGTTVRQIDVAAVTYHHVELARHDVILAEGLPAETFLDTGNRRALDPAHPAPRAGRDDRNRLLWEALGYAPLCIVGEAVDRVRLSLACFAQSHPSWAPAASLAA